MSLFKLHCCSWSLFCQLNSGCHFGPQQQAVHRKRKGGGGIHFSTSRAGYSHHWTHSCFFQQHVKNSQRSGIAYLLKYNKCWEECCCYTVITPQPKGLKETRYAFFPQVPAGWFSGSILLPDAHRVTTFQSQYLFPFIINHQISLTPTLHVHRRDQQTDGRFVPVFLCDFILSGEKHWRQIPECWKQVNALCWQKMTIFLRTQRAMPLAWSFLR